MITSMHIKSALALAALLALPLAQAAMSKAELKTGMDRISEEYKTDKKACEQQSGNAHDICVESAKGKEKVAKAELTHNYSNSQADWNKLQVAKADAIYEVAKEKCDDKAGDAKDLCNKEAKTTHVTSLADAKLSKRVTEARDDAASDKRTAHYKLAIEKCESLAGDAKASCTAAAKADMGKN